MNRVWQRAPPQLSASCTALSSVLTTACEWAFLPSSSWVGFSRVSSCPISASRGIVIRFLQECKVWNVSITGFWWNSIAVVGVSRVSSFRLLVSVLEYHQEWPEKEEEGSRQTDRPTDRGELREVDRERVSFWVFGTDRFNPDLERWRNGVVGFFSWWQLYVYYSSSITVMQPSMIIR